MDNEDLKILELVINKLIQAHTEDASAFRCEYEDDTNSFWDESNDTTYKARSKAMTIDWDPRSYSWTPKAYVNQLRVSLHYDIACQTVSINIDGHGHTIFIDGGSKNKDIKIKYVKLFRAIEFWQEVEIPRREREKFVNATTKAFPDLFDALILEEIDEQETKGGDT